MNLDLQVTAVSFQQAALGQRYRLDIRVAVSPTVSSGWISVASSSEPLADTAAVIEPADTQAIQLRGPRARIEPRLHEFVHIWARVLHEDGGVAHHIQYRYPANRFHGTARISGYHQPFAFWLNTSYRGAPRRRRVIYARRGHHVHGATTQRVDVSEPAVWGAILPVIPAPATQIAEMVQPAWITESNNRVYGHEPGVPHAVNPSVLPAWPGRGRPDAAWLRQWQSEIAISVLTCRGVELADVERDLRWDHEVVEGSPEVVFTSSPRGYRVLAFARGRGEVRIFATYRGQRVSELRSLVREPITFAARTIVLLPTEVEDHGVHAEQRREMEALGDDLLASLTAEANGYLRQVALALPRMTIEHRTVAVSRTVGLDETRMEHYAEPYGRTRTVTFLVIHSTDGANFLGKASGIVGSGAPGTDLRQAGDGLTTAAFTESGSPSTSWLHPVGLPPGPPATAHIMRFIRSADVDRPVIYLVHRASTMPGPPPLPGGSTTTSATGGTMAHELGHVLGLLHRGPEEDEDQLRSSAGTNLMAPGCGHGDLDIAQAKVIWASPLLRRQR